MTNIGAGIGVRVTGNMEKTALTLEQKTPGAMDVVIDIDHAKPGNYWQEARLNILTASSLNIVFDSDILADLTGPFHPDNSPHNRVYASVAGGAATSISIESGGNFAQNIFQYNNGAAPEALTSITLTGTQPMQLLADGPNLALIDASSHTGGLHMNPSMAANGVIKLGQGTDMIHYDMAASPSHILSLSGFEKSADNAVYSNIKAIAEADKFATYGKQVANASTVAGGAVDANGVLKFTGAGPATLAAAFAIAELAAESDREMLVFEYLSNSYVFSQGSDAVIRLIGLSGITHLLEAGTSDTFLVV